MSKTKIILMWGVTTALICEAHKAILIAQGISLSGWGYLNLLIFFLGLFIGIKQVKDKLNGGYMKFAQGYMIGLLITAIVTVIGLISVVITLQVVPDLGTRLINESRTAFVNAGMRQDMIDKMMEMAKIAYTPSMIISKNIFGNIFLGLILSLIAAGVNVKKKPFSEEEMSGNEGTQV